jgi:hypothetical protein
MKIEFTTETGSNYTIYTESRVWFRENQTDKSGPLRTEGGNIFNNPEVKVGQSVIIETDPINPPLSRVIITSPVVSIEESNIKLG